jgi:cobalt-zinc-cadmium resistance protein CzcA
MLDRIIYLSVKNKLIIVLLTLTIVGFGIFSMLRIPLGAVPDITNNQVQVITTSTSLSTQDVEQFITYPVELEMSNLPGVTEIRSISKFGLSVVTIVFEDKLGTYLPRQLIAEKIKSAEDKIPAGFGTPEMGPITTGLGEIYQYILDIRPGYEDKYTIMDLRTIQDWVVKRQLSGIPGVVEVNTWGGYLKQYEVAIDPERLQGMGITLLEVFDALQKNNSIAGGAYIEKQNQSYFIRGDGLITSLDEMNNVVVANREGVPILVKDIAKVRFGSANRFGAITANGEGEKVMGQIMMLKDANSNQVIRAVKQRVEEVQESLPEGVFINPIIERSELIKKTSHTVLENILFGVLIVFFTVVILLGNLRSGLVIASIIPLSLLFTLSMMNLFGIDANLMSLGALDFGIIIDGAVIIVEFIAIRLTVNKDSLQDTSGEEKQNIFDKITYEGASKMVNSAIFGQVIILIVFIPVLSLSGVEGKMFRPMALSFSFAVLGAMFFGLTWLPVASALFLRPEKKKPFRVTSFIMKVMYRTYDPVIRWSYDHKGIIFSLAAASLVVTGIIFSRMGGEFVPTLDEGDFVIQPVLKTGTSLSKTVEMTTRMEQILLDNFTEVEQIVCRIGAAEVPTDPMSMEEIDMIIKLKPKDTWVAADSKEELANRFKEALSVLPGIDYEFTQPIEMRFNELITGVRADLAIKIFGEDLELLADLAREVKDLIIDVPGAADVILEKTEGLPQMSVRYFRGKVAYYGLSVEDLNTTLTMAFGGAVAGVVFEGEKRFDLVVRLQPGSRSDIEHIRRLPVALSNGQQIPLSELADIKYAAGPAKISRDDTRRRVVVSVNVRNRDLESVVEDVESILSSKLDLPAGYYIDYGGQFENLRNASRRLKLAVPIALLMIFIFLHFAFNSFKEAALIFTAVPLSVVGGVFLLWIRGMPFSISAGIGFIALFGVAVLNGIVLIEHLKDLKKQGVNDMRERILRGTRERLRPVLLTASAAALGFLPMAVSTSAGAEVQRPLATVVIGGLITSTMLTMLALPLLYSVVDTIVKIRPWPPRIIRGGTVILVLLFLIPCGIFAQTGEGMRMLSLEEALGIAVKNNSELKAYRLSSEESRALIRTSREVDPTTVYYHFDQNNVAENGYPIGVFGAEQRFDFPTVYSARKEAGNYSYEMSVNAWEKKQRELMREVTLAYYRVAYFRDRLLIYEQLDSLYQRLGKASQTGYEQGMTSYLEMLNSKSKKEESHFQKENAARDVQIAYEKMASIMEYDSLFVIPAKPLERLRLFMEDTIPDPGLNYLRNSVNLLNAELREEKNGFLPDITLTYFNGTNHYPGSLYYQGFQVGLGVPLFFGAQRARVRAKQYAVEAALQMEDHYIRTYRNRLVALKSALTKYDAALSYYEETGRDLARELSRSAVKSYESGQISFFNFIQSLENALEIELNHLENLSRYNELVVEIKYLTIMNN